MYKSPTGRMTWASIPRQELPSSSMDVREAKEFVKKMYINFPRLEQFIKRKQMKTRVPMLTGAKIKTVRTMTNAEAEEQGWEFRRHGACVVIELDNGVKIFPSCDPEGNGEGCLFGEFNGDGFYVEEESQNENQS